LKKDEKQEDEQENQKKHLLSFFIFMVLSNINFSIDMGRLFPSTTPLLKVLLSMTTRKATS